MDRILQFGTGRFLRGFVGAFAHDLGHERSITMVESTGSGTAARLAAQDRRYRLLIRGIQDGVVVDTASVVSSTARTVDAGRAPEAVAAAALDPELRIVVSNTTEAGYTAGPTGFPARLLDVLVVRARAGLAGVTILPCELVERNGDRLQHLVLAEAATRSLEPALIDQVRSTNTWTVTLVDRIVTAAAPTLPGVAGDPLAIAAEPFASWVIEGAPDLPLLRHPAVRRVDDVGPAALRKIRILNGAHTALVARTRGRGMRTVRAALDDPDIAAWLEALLRQEVVPALGDRIDDGDTFVSVVLERFRNPFLDHQLADIALHHATKLRTRLLPTAQDHLARFGRRPARLAWVLDQG